MHACNGEEEWCDKGDSLLPIACGILLGLTGAARNPAGVQKFWPHMAGHVGELEKNSSR